MQASFDTSNNSFKTDISKLPNVLSPGQVFPKRNYVLLSIYWFAISFLWGGFLSAVLPALNKPLATPIFGANNNETILGIMTGLGLIIAMFVQPLAGAISDQSASRFGRRRPFMVIGTFGVFGALILVVVSGSWWLLLLSYILLQFADNLSQGAYQGLMPDVVPEEKRDRASAALGMSQLIGTLIGAVVPGILQGILGEITGSQVDLLLVAIVFAISLFLTCVFIKEKPYIPVEKVSPVKAGLSMFKGVRHYPNFILLMVARLFFLTAPATLDLFVKSFLENRGFIDPSHVMNGDTATAALQTANDSHGQPLAIAQAGGTLSIVLGIVILSAIAAIIPFSRLSERIGRKKTLYIATAIGLIGGVGLIVPSFIIDAAVSNANAANGLASDLPYLKAVLAVNDHGQLTNYLSLLQDTRGLAFPLIAIFGAFIGFSWGAFVAVDWAFATTLIPANQAGRFMGLSNLATAGCQAFGAFVGGFIVDSALGYTGLFVMLCLYYVISVLVLLKVRENRREVQTGTAVAQPG